MTEHICFAASVFKILSLQVEFPSNMEKIEKNQKTASLANTTKTENRKENIP